MNSFWNVCSRHLQRAWKTLGSCCSTLNRWHVLPFVLLILYSIIGGIVFYMIENDDVHAPEPTKITELMRLRQRIEHVQMQMTSRLFNLARSEDRNYKMTQVKESWKWYNDKLLKDLKICRNNTMEEHHEKWDFWSAVYYAVTVYTTIGYGDITPKTTSGKMMTIVYALIGIPLMFYILQSWGTTLLLWAQKGARLTRKVVSRYSSRVSKTTTTDQDLPLTIACLMVILWLCFAAALFLAIEDNWTYMTSFYFLFISFTTIGFGDVVPLNRGKTLLCIIPVIIGLSVVSMVIALLQEKINAMFNSMREKIEVEYRVAQQEPDKSRLVATQSPEETMDQLSGLLEDAPFGRKIFFKMLNRSQKNMLQTYWTNRSSMRNVGTQTAATARTEDEVQTTLEGLPSQRRPSYIYNAVE